jgi:hypothetical protein
MEKIDYQTDQSKYIENRLKIIKIKDGLIKKYAQNHINQKYSEKNINYPLNKEEILQQKHKDFLLTSLGFSSKDTNKNDFYSNIIKDPEFLKNLQLEEIKIKYIISTGGSLTGIINNIIGKLAYNEISNCILQEILNDSSIDETINIQYPKNNINKHNKNEINNITTLNNLALQNNKAIKQMNWNKKNYHYTLIFNKNIPNLRPTKNIDILLFKSDNEKFTKNDIILAGEIKGGYDRAENNERASSTKNTLTYLKANIPHSKFVYLGASISAQYSDYLNESIKNNNLHKAANLTKSDQIESFSKWLISL